MPPDTVKVDRTTKWGNPFVTGTHGTREECVLDFKRLMAGFLCISVPSKTVRAQEALRDLLLREKRENFPSLRGKNLACWCPLGATCHADVLLEIANRPPSTQP